MKYWVYMNGEVPGSYTPGELASLPGFSASTLVCPAEGEILEKNWRRAEEFDEVGRVLRERGAAAGPGLPGQAESADVNILLDTASARLFARVSELMRELENSREEKAELAGLKQELASSRASVERLTEKVQTLEGRIPRIGELEEALAKERTRLQGLEEAVSAREEGMRELRQHLEKSRGELENAKRRLGETQNDLAIRNRLVDKLSRDLTDKELSLAKALGLIRRLEEDLHKILPVASSAPKPPEEHPAVPLAEAEPGGEEELPSLDSSPPQPPVPPGPAPSEAQGALTNLFKRLTSRQDH